jgi:NADH dehydrogenase
VLVDSSLEVPGYPGVFALGDCTVVPDPRTGKAYPPTAQHAIRQAKTAATNVAASFGVGRREEFVFDTLGSLAVLGHRTAVAEIKGRRFAGFLAWWMWRTVYLSKLPRLDRQIRVIVDWTLDLFFPADIVQLGMGKRRLPAESTVPLERSAAAVAPNNGRSNESSNALSSNGSASGDDGVAAKMS